ncbi:MAG: NAD(P)H-dependent glycerol-3-phosphate dehydrogenase [Bacteroidota bacterium]
MSARSVGVIGAGNFGTAVANLLAQNTHVLLYTHSQETADRIQQTGFAAGQLLEKNISVTTDLGYLTAQCTLLFIMVPSQAFRQLLETLAPLLHPDHMLIHGTKGLDVAWPTDATVGLARRHVKTMSELIRSSTPTEHIGCLSGPTFASQLAKKQPTGAVLASLSEAVIQQGHQWLQGDYFHVYPRTDLLGVELCGVLKNSISLSIGCLEGIGYDSANTKALLLTQGLVEMTCIGKCMGTDVRSFMGLAGIGDLVATCTGPISRNYRAGYLLAQGTRPKQLLADAAITVEGIQTVKTIYNLAMHYQLRAPITKMMYKVLFEEYNVQEAMQQLLSYPMHLHVEV